MRTLARSFIVVLVLLWAPVWATVPAPLTLSEAFTNANHVLLVRIVEARTIDTPEMACGARYVGVVVRSLKGASVGSRVEFGPYIHLRFGAHYLVFLANSQLAADRYLSTNSAQLAAYDKFLDACKHLMAPLSITNFGAGAMLVDEGGRDVGLWSINWESLIELPSSVHADKTKFGTLVNFGAFENCVQPLEQRR